MNRTLARWPLLLVACLAVLSASFAHGQESLFGPAFKEPPFYPGLTAAEGLRLAKEQSRVLIIVVDRRQAAQGRRDKWESDTLRAWLKWHAIVVEPKGEERQLIKDAYFPKNPRDNDDRCQQAAYHYGFVMFIDGCQYCPFWPVPPKGTKPATRDMPDRERFQFEVVKPDGKGTVFEQFEATPIMTLFELDRQLELAMAQRPIWALAHKTNCPEPQPPARTTLFDGKDGLAPAFPEPLGRDKVVSGRRAPIDVLDIFSQARAHASAGRAGEALAAYSWLFERAVEEDPAFELVVQLLVSRGLAQVAPATAKADQRVRALLASELSQYPWAEYERRYAYLDLCKRLGQFDQASIRLDVEANDTDESAMTPTAELVAINIMADRLGADVTKPVTEAWINHQLKLLKARRPDRADFNEWQRMLVFRRWMIARECMRSFALLIEASQPEQAMPYARRAIELSPDDATRTRTLRTLAITAIALDRVHDQARRWLDEAGEGDDSPIRKHLSK